MQKYVSAAHERIKHGPRSLIDPGDEFRRQDMEDYLRDKCLEIQAGKRYQCDFCKKSFISEDFVLKHIRNKHQDKVDEVYERESTKNWLEKNIQQKLKKEMKQNYYADENKLFNQPGRKYHSNESSFYQFNRGGDNHERGGHFSRGRGGYKPYRDLDDPKMTQTFVCFLTQKPKQVSLSTPPPRPLCTRVLRTRTEYLHQVFEYSNI